MSRSLFISVLKKALEAEVGVWVDVSFFLVVGDHRFVFSAKTKIALFVVISKFLLGYFGKMGLGGCFPHPFLRPARFPDILLT